MSMKRFRPYHHESEQMLLPPSLREWLPEDHEIYFISDAVEQMDLSKIMAAYEEPRGNPPYHPKMMVKVLVYAYARGVRGSRRIERMLWEDVPMRVLAGNQQPDHWTIAAFRRRHIAALGQLFEQTVRMAQKAKLVQLGHVAIDGTKIKANASKHSAMSYGRMRSEEERLRKDIKRYFQDSDEVDAEEDKIYGDRRGNELPPELGTRQKRLEAIRKAKAALEAEARAKAEEEKKAKGGKSGKDPATAVPDDKAQRNFTDPESRIMRSSDKGFIQAYNAQAAVDTAYQIIVAADATNQAADSPHLIPLADQVETNSGRRLREVSADAGYFSENNVTDLLKRGIEVLIPPKKVRHSEWREMTSPRGRPPRNLDLRGRMWWKLRTKRGRQRYKLRQQTVEPVFGQIKWNRGLHQWLLRGLAAVRESWRFECAVHNLLKMRTAGVAWA